MKLQLIEDYSVLLVGYLVPEKLEPMLLEQPLSPMQSQRFEGALLDSLLAGFQNNVEVFSVAPLLDYPKSRILFSPSAIWSPREGVAGHLAHYINLLGAKHLTRFFTTLVFVASWTFRRRSSRRVIIMHDANSAQIWGVVIGSMMYKSLLLSYLTDDLALSWPWEKWYHRIFHKIDTQLLRSGLNRMSFLITMTPDLAKKWGTGKANVVIPAILPSSSLRTENDSRNSSLFNIVYSGGLEEHFGVRILLEAFCRSPYSHWRLIVTGKGQLSNEIAEFALTDNRIVYKGLVPFRELNDIYNSASVFVNPRSSSDERTRFLFPSKIVEQMATGKPVISTDLACLTDQFRKHLLIVTPETSNRLLEILIQADRMGNEERYSWGLRAKEFVIQNYSPPMVGQLISNAVRKFAALEQE